MVPESWFLWCGSDWEADIFDCYPISTSSFLFYLKLRLLDRYRELRACRERLENRLWSFSAADFNTGEAGLNEMTDRPTVTDAWGPAGDGMWRTGGPAY